MGTRQHTGAPPSSTLQGLLPFQRRLLASLVCVFGVCGSLESISPPEVKTQEHFKQAEVRCPPHLSSQCCCHLCPPHSPRSLLAVPAYWASRPRPCARPAAHGMSDAICTVFVWGCWLWPASVGHSHQLLHVNHSEPGLTHGKCQLWVRSLMVPLRESVRRCVGTSG